MDTFEIDERAVGPGEPAYIIAEAGSNHNGDLSLAKKLIDQAANSGVDAIKFQTFRAKDLYVENTGKAGYLDDDRSIYEMIESLEMPYDWIPELHEYCSERGVDFLSTPFDHRSASELEEFVPAWKVASYTSSHHPFLRHLADTDKPILMSTGAHDVDEIRESVDVLETAGVNDLVLLQCVSAYPTPMAQINVRVIRTLRDTFGFQSGLSDHTLDPTVAPTAAVALGASVVEKHFTLDKGMDGPDHQFALEPDELDSMVSAIRATEQALGSGKKQVLPVEKELHRIARRRIHALRNIEPGEKLTKDNIGILRSGQSNKGLEPKYFEEVLGSTADAQISKDQGITWEDIDT